MCTLVAKKFPNIGWVGIKNRDRSYSTQTELLRDQFDDIQRVTLMDEKTRWSEGMNSNGVSIISSSLVPEPTPETHISVNGQYIKDALKEPTIERAIESLKGRISGCVMIFNETELWLIEGMAGGNKQIIRKVNEDRIARTNHGIWLPKAGYQKNSSDVLLKMRRISSEARLLIARYIIDTATSPAEMMIMMAKRWTDNPQINTLRRPIDHIKTRTTEQLMLDPGQQLILVRNTDGVLDFDQSNANPKDSKILVGIID